MIFCGTRWIGTVTYSYSCIGVFKKKFLMSKVMNFAAGVLRTLLMRIFVSMRFVACDVHHKHIQVDHRPGSFAHGGFRICYGECRKQNLRMLLFCYEAR